MVAKLKVANPTKPDEASVGLQNKDHEEIWLDGADFLRCAQGSSDFPKEEWRMLMDQLRALSDAKRDG